MKKKNMSWITISLCLIILSSIACQAFAGGNPDESIEVIATQVINAETPINFSTEEQQLPTEALPVTYDTDFPLPEDVQNFQKVGEQDINYQTSMSIDEIIAFYRQEFSTQGLSEVGVLTHIDDDNFSIVFSGTAHSEDIVVQGVQLDPNTLNENVRYEDV